MGRRVGTFTGLAFTLAFAAACSDGRSPSTGVVTPQEPAPTRGSITIPSGSLPKPEGATITLPGGGVIHLVEVAGVLYVPIEGTFGETSFRSIVSEAASRGLSVTEQKVSLDGELKSAVGAIGGAMTVLNPAYRASVGYFTALVPLESYPVLRSVAVGRSILVNPVVSAPFDDKTRGSLKRAKELGLTAFDGDPRANPDAFSGLGPMGVPEFLTTVENELGETPDGSLVKVGVVDTGVTYNHPAFENASGVSRIGYMKDFTGEGRIFFAPAARFDITIPATVPAGTNAAELLELTADFLLPKTGSATPPADVFSSVTSQPILVSPALRAILTTPGSGARLGVFDEASLATRTSGVDVNRNGKTNDKLYAILVPGQNGAADVMYFDPSGKWDFRQSPALASFNVAKDTISVFAEKFGFDIKRESILDSAGAQVEVVTAGIVGFDPGQHGSHVSSTIGGRKMIQNGPAASLARGVAPDTNLMVNRVCARNGGCRATEAIIDLAENGAEVINMSIGSLSTENDGYGVQEAVMNRLFSTQGTLFFAAAGNEGPGRRTVSEPANARLAISVGATASPALIQRQYQWPGSGKVLDPNVENEDFLLDFSSRGPSAAGGLKPDLMAPGTVLAGVQLNAAPGTRAGLEVMWGTSMATPTAAGAAALLLDAAKRYNAQHPSNPVATDSTTLRRVLTGSARAFDVTSLNTATGATRTGHLTWVDQGNGMLNLPRAWTALKAERNTRGAPAVTVPSTVAGGVSEPLSLDYEMRVLRRYPNGVAYDGSTSVDTVGGGREPRYGRGVWIDADAQDSLFTVQIARRLPTSVMSRTDIGNLTRSLVTTADEFEIQTTVQGSQSDWVTAGTLNQLDCSTSPTANLTVLAEGAVDLPINADSGAGGSSGPRDSTLYLCVDRTKVAALPPGDHGALVKAYRVVAGVREAVPTFTVPVYVTVPHRTLAGTNGYSITSHVRSFGVAHNYISVPQGTSLVTISMEVPAATVQGKTVTGCAATWLTVYEGTNSDTAAELTAAARNCGSSGLAAPDAARKVTYTRVAPRAGIWDLDVFGLYSYADSPYTLKVEFAKVEATPKTITGTPAALTGSVNLNVLEASYAVTPSATKSKFALDGFEATTTANVAKDATLQAPDATGAVARVYGADITSVTIGTGGSTGNDIDLTVKECTDQALTSCRVAGSSGGATDVESVTFAPRANRFYVVEVLGYAFAGGAAAGDFTTTETLKVKTPEPVAFTLVAVSPTQFRFDHTFNAAGSALLGSSRVTGGQYGLVGALDVADGEGVKFLSIPVKVKP